VSLTKSVCKSRSFTPIYFTKKRRNGERREKKGERRERMEREGKEKREWGIEEGESGGLRREEEWEG
jgi:hypothetical protein